MFLLEPGNITRDGGKMSLAWLSLHLEEISHFDREKVSSRDIENPICTQESISENRLEIVRDDIVRFDG